MVRACEGLDDEHRRTTVSTQERGLNGVRPGGCCGEIGAQLRCGMIQELAGRRDLGLAVGIGE